MKKPIPGTYIGPVTFAPATDPAKKKEKVGRPQKVTPPLLNHVSRLTMEQKAWLHSQGPEYLRKLLDRERQEAETTGGRLVIKAEGVEVVAAVTKRAAVVTDASRETIGPGRFGPLTVVTDFYALPVTFRKGGRGDIGRLAGAEVQYLYPEGGRFRYDGFPPEWPVKRHVRQKNPVNLAKLTDDYSTMPESVEVVWEHMEIGIVTRLVSYGDRPGLYNVVIEWRPDYTV